MYTYCTHEGSSVLVHVDSSEQSKIYREVNKTYLFFKVFPCDKYTFVPSKWVGSAFVPST